jgi:hypothetical protein
MGRMSEARWRGRHPVCKRCGDERDWGKLVSNEVWYSMIPVQYRQGVLCQECLSLFVDAGDFVRHDRWFEAAADTDKSDSEVERLGQAIMCHRRYWDDL